MKRRMLSPLVGAAVASALVLAGCERPPVHTTQMGYRGTGMQQVQDPRLLAAQYAANALPAVGPPAPAGGPTAGSLYKNVKVLGDLSAGEFARTMVAITAWVAPPDQSCAYCHAGGDLASDAKYTKVVARRMLQMVHDINGNWHAHVGQTGVTCFTCHRGHAVPAYVWFDDPGQPHPSEMAGNRAGKNAPSAAVGLSALPNDPWSHFLESQTSPSIRVVSTHPLAQSGVGASMKDAETSYGLMMAISQSLGVNCTFCHNSRSFMDWSTSTPQRVTAWHGLQMVRALNANYLEPLAATLPPNRHGPLGDGPKLDCATCHQGVSKPLFGQSMLKDFPALQAQPTAAATAPATGTATP